MRLTLALLAAIGLHGAMFGVAAALLSPAPAQMPPAIDVDVAIIPPRPAPIADSAPGPAAPPPNPTPAPSRPRALRHGREVASLDNSMPASVPSIPSAEHQAVAVSVAAPSVSPGRAPVTAGAATPQGGGAVLSAQPRYHTNPSPDYPLPSLRRREEGIVLLDVQVQADGTPAAISLHRSCGHPLLDRAALDAVRRWTFEPARAAGVAVASLVVIPVRFSLAEQP
jgi:protein TonB